ncbi:MAG: MFS transporter [Stackebrandtia sp.]
MSVSTPTSEPTNTRWRSHVALLTAGAFAVGTDGFVIAGILPSIAADLHVDIAAAGQLVTVFAIAYAVTTPLLATLTASWPMHRVLLVALALFGVGNAMTALAPDYTLVLVSRVIAAAGAGAYTANASATATMLAGEKHRGRALSLVVLGSTTALAIGAPLGTAIGTAMGWRAAIWGVTGLALLVAPLITLRLPRLASQPGTGLRERLRPLTDRRILRVLVVTLVVFTGIYIPYTYISAIYAPAVGGDGNLVAVLLLVFGIGGTVGNLVVGRLSDRYGPRPVILAVTCLLTVGFVALPLFRGSLSGALAAVAVSSVLSFGVVTPQQHLIMSYAPGMQSVVASWFQSALYVAISLSGAVGAVGLSLWGAVWLPVVAAAATLGGAVIHVSGHDRASR